MEIDHVTRQTILAALIRSNRSIEGIVELFEHREGYENLVRGYKNEQAEIRRIYRELANVEFPEITE